MAELLRRINIIEKRGAYVIEATIILPVIILCVLSLGYFTQIQGMWENCVHCALDESGKTQAMAWDGISPFTAKLKIEERIEKSDFMPSSFSLRGFGVDAPYKSKDHINRYTLSAHIGMNLPAGFSKAFDFSMPVLYRGFVGKNIDGDPLGVDGLEAGMPGDPAHVFPAHGKRYHGPQCTYVTASVKCVRLNSSVRHKYSSCSICKSEELSEGSIVFCFESPGTAYHRASCRTINRHVIVMDKGEASEKGYTPCSKCSGQ